MKKVRKPRNLVEMPFTLKEYERGVLLRLGKSKGVLNPGLHASIPHVDEVVIVDIRPQMYEYGAHLLTKDNHLLDASISLRYRIDDAEKYVVRAPEEVDPQLDFLLGAEAANVVCKGMEMKYALENRDEVGNRVQTFLSPHMRGWGLDLETVQVDRLNAPAFVPELQEELYRTQMFNVIGPLRARAEATMYREKTGAVLDAFKGFTRIVTETGEQLAKTYGPSEARDIMYVLFAKQMGDDDPIGKKVMKKLEMEGVAEGAKKTAEMIESSPQYAHLMQTMKESLQGMKGVGLIDMRSISDIYGLDKKLKKELGYDK